MQPKNVAQKFLEEGLISEESFNKIENYYSSKPFSLYYHIKTFMYLGVLMLASGLGILVYKNIDSIGHVAVVIFIGLLSLSCLYYCYTKREIFSWQKTASSDQWFDYILLLGSLTFVTFIGYLQWNFQAFGETLESSFCITTFFLFFIAYFFDHLGILSLAVMSLASWLGIKATPDGLFGKEGLFFGNYIYTGTAFSISLSVFSELHKKFNMKKHFAFTYINFAFQIAFASALSGIIILNFYLLWIPILLIFLAVSYIYSKREKSSYILVFAILYSYIAVSYIILKYLYEIIPQSHDEIGIIYMALFYFIASCFTLVYFLRRIKIIFKENEYIV